MLRQMTPNWSKFTDACMKMPVKPIFYAACDKGYGDELCLITKNPGTYAAPGPVRGRGFGTMQRSARFIGNTSQNQFINFGNLTAWNIGTQGSFCGWLRLNQVPGPADDSNAVVFARGLSPDSFSDRTFNLYVVGDGIAGPLPRFRIFRGSSTSYTSNGTTVLVSGVWYFLSGSYIQGSTVQVYLNGLIDGPNVIPTNFSINNPNSRSLQIGRDGTTSASVVNEDYEVMHCCMWSGVAWTEAQWRKLYAEAFASPLSA